MVPEGRRPGEWTLPIWFGAALGALAFYWPAFDNLHRTGFGDWQQFQHQWEAAYVAIARFGELPLWNPFHCGGVMLWGDPQAQGYSPLFFLSFFVGTTVALKIFLAVHATVGMAGMYILLRREFGSKLPILLVGTFLWAGSGFFAWHGSGGHSAFLPFYFTPWIVILYRRAIDDVRWSAAVAALMALTLFEGGVYPFPFFSLLLIYETLVGWIRPGKRWETLRAALVTAPLILLMGAFRLAPILDTMSRYPRPTKGADAITMLEILDMLTAQAHARKFGHQFVWDEYGTYVGWIGVALFLVGVLWMIWARRWALTGATFLFGSLVLGHGSDFHPWALLHHLPVFDSLRVPSRFAVLATFFLAIGATGAMETARRSFAQHRRRRSGRIAYGLLMAGLWFGLAVLVMDVMETHKPQMRRWNYAAPPALAQGEPYHFVSDSRYYQYASFPARNVSNRRCYSGMNYTGARGLWVGKVDQVRFRPRRGGKLEAFDRTTNTITAKVTLRKDATLIFNQTYAHGWTASKGTLVPDRHRRMTVTLPKGTHTVVLTYWPPRFLPAALGSALGVLLALLVALFGRGRRPPKAVAPPETSP